VRAMRPPTPATALSGSLILAASLPVPLSYRSIVVCK
jgi:hypothetical protein